MNMLQVSEPDTGVAGLELRRNVQRLASLQHALQQVLEPDQTKKCQALLGEMLNVIGLLMRDLDAMSTLERTPCRLKQEGRSSDRPANRVPLSLTPRQRQVLGFVLDGTPSKSIAAALGLSQRTVENHRASLMKAIGAKSIPDLVRIVMERM